MVCGRIMMGRFILLLFAHNLYTDSAQTIDIALLSCVLSTWYFPQFSALYPEMVDAVVLLDSYGFLPAKSVLYLLYTTQRITAGL